MRGSSRTPSTSPARRDSRGACRAPNTASPQPAAAPSKNTSPTWKRSSRPFGIDQPLAGEALQDSQRRSLRLPHRVNRQQKRLLELILPRHGGVAHLIGERKPRRACRKINRRLRRSPLKVLVLLHPIVELQHQR